ncbi:MAG: hypothetical protein V4591_12520 [Bdellovibrionota bacterium]
MKDLRDVGHFSAEQQSTDGIVSHMLMGFVERKISPQTIADALRAQIFESQIPIGLLNGATCNGILEAVTLANSTEDCTDLVLYFSTHPNFPHCLSFKAAVGALCVLLRDLQKTHLLNKDNMESYSEGIEKLSEYILNIFHTSAHLIDFELEKNLLSIIQNISLEVAKTLQNNVHFQHLRFMLVSKSSDGVDVKGFLPKAYDMIALLLKTPEEQLLRNGVDYYKTEQSDKNYRGRIKYLKSIVESLQISSFSEAKKTFLVEWIFDRALLEAAVSENTNEYTLSLKYCMENFSHESYMFKGLLKSIQKDFSALEHMNDEKIFEKCEKLGSLVFPYLVTKAEKDLNYILKQVINWILEMPVSNEQFRFFKKHHWRWIRSLSAKTWDASLREPPAWVVTAGSVYCASIFHSAPALWLQEYSVALIERVYQESLAERFEATTDHFNYVEYLIRCARKKSPFFASRTESLFALYLMSRMTQSETLQFANAKVRFQTLFSNYTPTQIQISQEFVMWKQILDNEEKFKNQLGNNPVTRALAILTTLSQETAKK